MALKVTEVRELVRKMAVKKLGLNTIEGCQQYGASDYTFPVTINDGGNNLTYNVKVAITKANDTDTKRTKAFDPNAAAQSYRDTVEENERLARENEKIAKEMKADFAKANKKKKEEGQKPQEEKEDDSEKETEKADEKRKP